MLNKHIKAIVEISLLEVYIEFNFIFTKRTYKVKNITPYILLRDLISFFEGPSLSLVL